MPRNGRLSVTSVPDPLVRSGHVLIANSHSVISAGTEKMVMDLAKKSLLGKARSRPALVRQILQKLRTDGVFKTLGQVFAKLNEPIGLGYSSAGVVLVVGEGVQEPEARRPRGFQWSPRRNRLRSQKPLRTHSGKGFV